MASRDELTIHTEAELEWWRPLIQWFLCLPHLLYVGVLTIGSLLVGIATGVAVLVTGRVPGPAARFQALCLRERVRCFSYFFVLRRSRPPYATAFDFIDPGDDSMVSVSLAVPERLPRTTVVVRPLVLIPHALALVPLAVVLDVCYPLWMAVAAAGRGWPAGTADFLVRVERWVGAVLRYGLLVTDQRPAFGLSSYAEPLTTQLNTA